MGKNSKKAELTSASIVGLVLLVLGFVIVLIFYFQLSGTERVDTEVCHQSVVYRATLPDVAGLKEYVPLKCKTRKICITAGFFAGECKEFEGSKGITKVKVGNEREIEKTIADKVLSCWQMMGEGKVPVFTEGMAQQYGIGTVGSSCVVCNRIAFDKESLGNAGIDLDKVDVMDFMIRNRIPGKNISYFTYLAGEGGLISLERLGQSLEINDIQESEEGKPELIEGVTLELEEASKTELDKEVAVLFMQVSAPTHTGVFASTVGTILGIRGASYMVSPGILGRLGGAVLKSPVAWIAAVVGIGLQQLNVWSNAGVTATYCGDITVGDESREGCSVVRTIDYDFKSLSEYCSVIESIA